MHILTEITAHKQDEIRQNRKQRPVSGLLADIKDQGAPRPFFKNLKENSQVAVIPEIKKASPSAGVIREDFEPESIAEAYAGAGAGAISVLTDEHFFQGKLDYLVQVHQNFGLPCLRKDFMIDPYQIIEARAHSADIVLLIMAILSDGQFDELAAAAQEFDLEVLTEVHDSSELERAMKYHARNIGINNRNLDTFEVDISTTDKLVTIIPEPHVIVSESGLKTRADIEHVGRQGVDAVLIGESLMRQPDIASALQDFVGVEKWSR